MIRSGCTGNFSTFIATVGPVGYLPIAPGTWGSGFAILVWWFAMMNLTITIYLVLLTIITATAVWSSSKAEKVLGRDSGHIVIDEVAGQLSALVICPQTVAFAVLGFFRNQPNRQPVDKGQRNYSWSCQGVASRQR